MNIKSLSLRCLLIIILTSMCISCTSKNSVTEKNESSHKPLGYNCDTLKTAKGRNVEIFFIKHGSLILNVDGRNVYIDPVTMFGDDFSNQPKADLLLVTHSHHDHLDGKAIDQLIGADTKLYGGGDVKAQDKRFMAVAPGDVITDSVAPLTITCIAAYNTTPDHLNFHPKERNDVGYLFDIDGTRIYVAGDTEVIPEMRSLDKVDVAFLPVNQPYTMTPDQAIEATKIIHPRILYPYHYGDTDLTPLFEFFLPWDSVEVRDRNMQ